MKHSHTLAAIAIAILLPLGAFAADVAPPPGREAAKAEATTAEAVKADAAKAQAKAKAKAKKAETRCEPSASSRVRKDPKDCGKDSQPVSTYTKEDLESTGQTDTAEALRRLDPRVH